MALRSKFITTYRQKHGLTHFLAIPLVTPTSITQVSDSFKCLWDDLAAIGVPNDAIRPLGHLHLNLDIPLSLGTSVRMAKATKILQEVSIKEIQSTSHKSSTSRDSHRQVSSASPTSKDDINNRIASPSVSISSLLCRLGREAEALTLSTKVYDPTHRVGNWKLRLAHAYQAAGLSPKQQQPKLRDYTVRLVKIPDAGGIPCEWEPGKLKPRILPAFDARGLLERYKEHVWIENASLGRVSICKMGLPKAGVEKLPEVFSVPLS